MKLLKRDIFLAGVLVTAIMMAATCTAADSTQKAATTEKATVKKAVKVMISAEEIAKLQKQLEIYEHAAANRELAALAQIEHARNTELKASNLIQDTTTEEIALYKSSHNKAGAQEKAAALQYGYAATNFDQATVNRKKAAAIYKKLGKVKQQSSSENYAINLKLQANDAIQMSVDAYEAAAVFYDKAEEAALMAICSQTAAVWLEQLALR